MGTRSAWTAQRRQRQREEVARTKPWLRSTGPKTKSGKASSARNAEAFRRDPEARKASILIQDLFKTGKMSAELGEILLAAHLSGPLDIIYEGGAYELEEDWSDPFEEDWGDEP